MILKLSVIYVVIDFKIGLSVCGLLVVGMSICFSFSLSSAAGWQYGPVHTILPFLLLGIGVDDMFVVVAALGTLTEEDKQKSLEHRISVMLKHAGVSITVTSFTDIIAFGVGGTTFIVDCAFILVSTCYIVRSEVHVHAQTNVANTTSSLDKSFDNEVLPALKSFCIFACIGVTALYLLSATFFVACITFDEKRKDAGRNACLCCYIHRKDYKTTDCSKKERIPVFLKNIYAPLLLKTPVKNLSQSSNN
ncbi:hypothetical protein KUTeg_015890 [Tegillarca granosa]|uniref:SSD domain-containing protein n=1 Tax=Tegillarca granosa TaxID=220873 RepID=A0ABQ9EJI3_TEGGR|nr:hypothetical protein KUTeg_015890 [Tegillarca granosa]